MFLFLISILYMFCVNVYMYNDHHESMNKSKIKLKKQI